MLNVLGERELDYFHKVGNHDIQYNVEVLRRELKRSKHRRNNRRLKAVSSSQQAQTIFTCSH